MHPKKMKMDERNGLKKGADGETKHSVWEEGGRGRKMRLEERKETSAC